MDKKELRKLVRSMQNSHRKAAMQGIHNTAGEDNTQDRKDSAGQERMPAELEELAEYLKGWQTVLLYWSLDDEVCTHTLVERLYKEGHRVLLPHVVSDTEMTLHPYAGQEQMRPGAWGILEPVTPSIDIATLDEGREAVAVVPGMAFDADGGRLGRGKGYYDRLLKLLPYIYKMGLCYDWQVVDGVPMDEYDVRMNRIITVR